ncbi:MAG: Uma2 family endonuclease [Spirosomataceae bacterium]
MRKGLIFDKNKDMTAEQTGTPKRRNRKIPAKLIREELKGEPLYYKGYRGVLNGNKKIEEIMGSSSLQSYLVGLVYGILFSLINRKNYIITTNETGLHLGHKNNLSTDIAIFLKKNVVLNDKYFEIAPEIAIEVDVKIETDKELDYIFAKSEEMLMYGTKKILWIITKHKKVFIITQGETTQIVDWDKDIYLMENITINIFRMLSEEGLTQ